MQRKPGKQNALVVVVEGLGPNLLSAYGSSTSATPALDRLAAEGILLDQCFVDSPDLALQLRSLWTAHHAFKAGLPPFPDCPLFTRHAGRLWTDSPQVATAATELGCETVMLVQPAVRQQPAEDVGDCAAMELFAAAAEDLASGVCGPLWIHSQGLRHRWDAPLDLRRQFTDPEDPDPPGEVVTPDCAVTSDTDPDIVVGWGQVAAAQAAVIDQGLGGLLATLAARDDADDWPCLFASLGGTPLGEHGRLGWGIQQLHHEELHAAAILRPAGGLPLGLRRPELFQLPDLAATILALLEQPGGEHHPPHAAAGQRWGQDLLQLGAAQSPSRWPAAFRLAMIAHNQQRWLRSPAWSALFADPNNPDEEARLYVKPEDRWEVSDIADRRREIVVRHRELAEVFCQAVQASDRSQLPPLEDDLCELLR
ncbi:MAG: hypothetical protein KDA45_00030 [Planctomycetales bacterium]|nr:hypothetical protein [Planctomycetales bacterium]